MQTSRRCLGQMIGLLRTTSNIIQSSHLIPSSASTSTSLSSSSSSSPSSLLTINNSWGGSVQQIRGVKDKHVLKLRCTSCYFKKIDERWWVLCDAYPRHKQRERVDDKRSRWIITHVTRGGRPFQKKTEAYICNTAPPGPYDFKPKIWPDTQPDFPKLKKSDYYCW